MYMKHSYSSHLIGELHTVSSIWSVAVFILRSSLLPYNVIVFYSCFTCKTLFSFADRPQLLRFTAPLSFPTFFQPFRFMPAAKEAGINAQ